MEDLLFLRGNVPSSKNSKQWTGKFLVHSKTVSKYLKTYEFQYKEKKEEFLNLTRGIPLPLFLGFHFVRDSRRKYDFHNAVQLVCDLMVKHGWIEDDNTKFIYPVPLAIDGEYQSLAKEGGVFIFPIIEPCLNFPKL